MNHRLFNLSIHRAPDAPGSGGSDDLDRLLRDWHDENTASARAGRDRLLKSVTAEDAPIGRIDADTPRPKPDTETNRRRTVRRPLGGASLFSGSGLAAAALFVVVGVLAVLVLQPSPNVAFAQVVQVPEGGRLDAFALDGEVIGPCPLRGTDVDVEISGPMIRVSLAQTFGNPYDTPIEAVYTFPMSHRAAVDRMVMTVTSPDGDERVVVGEIKERNLAREIYEAAKDAGYVTSLLEQERPNIFTQSVANIEPGATVKVEIGYVEVLLARDGEYAFEFPTVVGPRYIPGVSNTPSTGLPEGAVPRRGLVLRGPCTIVPFGNQEAWAEFGERSDQGFDGLTFAKWMRDRSTSEASASSASSDGLERAKARTYWTENRLFQALSTATRIKRPVSLDIDSLETRHQLAATGMVEYLSPVNNGDTPDTRIDHVKLEEFTLYYDGDRTDRGLGSINGRWFAWHLSETVETGGGFAEPTDQVPDADRITPMPVRPPMRAGHDIAIEVRVDTGGIPITSIDAPLHEIVETRDGPGRINISLANRREIPNRDFVLRWRLKDDAITESVFTHVAPGIFTAAGPELQLDSAIVPGGYLSMVIAPPARVESKEIRRRELVFVLDTSGSMSGFPIEKSKAVVARSIDAMRDGDTFNVITFAGKTSVLWPDPKPATPENREAARQFIEGLAGGGGTEMMDAIRTALNPTGSSSDHRSPAELADLPADGRMVFVEAPYSAIDRGDGSTWLVVRDGLRIPMELPVSLPTVKDGDPLVAFEGRWSTVEGVRRYDVAMASFAEAETVPPLRIVMFLTDGYVGNDQGIIQAIRDNAKSTRVFSLGIGNSVNRYLLDSMSREGRGAVEYVLLADGADEIVERLAKRIESPLLTNIEVVVEGVEAFEVLPQNPQGLLPDLFDAAPIILHARYRPSADGPVQGVVRITGETATGPYERRIPVVFPSSNDDNAVIATLWGRAKVDDVLAPHLAAVENGSVPSAIEAQVVALGEAYSIVTPFTSFIAVEKSRVVVGGQPMLVDIPIELPEGTNWDGFFGEDCPPVVLENAIRCGVVVLPARIDGGRDVGLQDESLEMDQDASLGIVTDLKAELFFQKGEANADAVARPEQSRASKRSQDPAGSIVGGRARRELSRESSTATRSFSAATATPSHEGLNRTPSRGFGGTGGGRFGGGGGGSGGGRFAGGVVGTTGNAPEPAAPSGGAPFGTTLAGQSADLGEDRKNIDSPIEGGVDLAAPEDVAVDDLKAADLLDAVEAAEPEPSLDPSLKPSLDMDRLWKVLDRRLLLLGFGADPSVVPGLPAHRLDGSPWIKNGSVEVTLRVNGESPLDQGEQLKAAGLVIEGSDASANILVGRISIDRLFDLAELAFVRRVMPTSGK